MRKDMPKGFREKEGKLKVAVAFDDVLFERIKARASKEKKTFGVMVNELCTLGLFDLEESDQYEPPAAA